MTTEQSFLRRSLQKSGEYNFYTLTLTAILKLEKVFKDTTSGGKTFQNRIERKTKELRVLS